MIKQLFNSIIAKYCDLSDQLFPMPNVEANNRSAILLNPVEYIIVYRAFAHDVTAAMLVFQFKRILIKLFCLEHQHGLHGFC